MKDILIVDGYNVVFSWPELKELSRKSLEHARIRLKDYLQNYGRHRGFLVILVFDGKLSGDMGFEEEISPDFWQVFTSDGITADSYIEREVFARKGKYTNVYVVTSDGAEQHQILGSGGLRIPVTELRNNILRAKEEEKSYYKNNRLVTTKQRSIVADSLHPEVAEKLEPLRHSKNKEQ